MGLPAFVFAACAYPVASAPSSASVSGFRSRSRAGRDAAFFDTGRSTAYAIAR